MRLIRLRIPRIFHRFYASIAGYFWLPCPICGEFFGGHESSATSLMTSWAGGKSVCPNCTEEARRRNKQFISQNPYPWRVKATSITNEEREGEKP